MRNVSAYITILIVSAFLCVPAIASDNISFIIEQKETRTFSKNTVQNGKNQPDKKEIAVKSTVMFYKDAFSVSENENERIYDFKSGKIFYINHSDKTYNYSDVITVPVFNIYEKRNQEMLFIKMPKETKVPELPKLSLFDLEMMFGADKDTAFSEKIITKSDKEKQTFMYDGNRFAEYSLSKYTISEGYKDVYKKYLLYEQHLHPIVIKSITENNTLFNHLNYSINSVLPSKIERKINVLSFEENSDKKKSYTTEGYKRIYSNNKKLNEIINASYSKKELSTEEYKKLIQEYLNKKDYMNSALTFFEYTLEYGKPDNTLIPLIQKTFKEAPEETGVKITAAALSVNPNSKEDLDKAIKILETVKQQGYKHGYIVNTFLANYYYYKKEPRKSIELFLEALESNPFLTMAYKDLGDRFLNEYDMQNTWLCWNRMREIRPDFGAAIEPVNSFETKIRENFPQYF